MKLTLILIALALMWTQDFIGAILALTLTLSLHLSEDRSNGE